MGKKKNPKVENLQVKPPSRISTLVEIILIYLGIVLGIIFLTIRCNLPMTFGQTPSFWLKIIWVVYYVFPVLLAVIFGMTFRPFWQNTRNVLVSILAIQIFFSFTVYVFRYDYGKRRDYVIQRSQWAAFQIRKFNKEFRDDNSDSRIDKIIFHAEFDMRDFPDGNYRLEAIIVKRGLLEKEYKTGSFDFSLQAGTSRVFKGHYVMDLETCPDDFKGGEFALNLSLKRIEDIDNQGRIILAFSRWSPFFRFTAWDGIDPQIKFEIIDLDHMREVESFTIIPLEINSSAQIFHLQKSSC